MSGGGQARLLGQWGEEQVAEKLRREGWTIVARNFRCRMGELDIVAKNDQFLAFVEVKLRKNDQFGSACEAVTPAKQRKLRAAAQFYLMSHPTTLQPRFDVAEVYAPQGIHTERPDIYYIKNAF
ncbi:MAG: YraN family protein [Oscillospiraceae bacterium]|nr:YraN family protein [Oscillospiraceae bacterium]